MWVNLLSFALFVDVAMVCKIATTVNVTKKDMIE